jgi:hypothetical protein
MPDLNDFYAFKSSSGGSNDGGGCGIGCLSPTVIIIAIILFVIYLIGKM